MSSNNDRPVRVTGQERRHPAIRTLARACIELARQQLERERDAGTDDAANQALQPEANDPKEEAADG